MDNPGFYTLGDFTITAANTYAPDRGAELTGLDGMDSCNVLIDFAYGSGGTSGKAYLQTSLNQANEGGVAGGTWIDIACFTFLLASKSKVYNFTRKTPVTAFTPSDGALADDTQIDGVLGDRLRLKTVTLGTYATSTILGARLVAA